MNDLLAYFVRSAIADVVICRQLKIVHDIIPRPANVVLMQTTDRQTVRSE